MQPQLRLLITARQRRVGVDNQVQGAGQVIEHQHLIGHHQQDVGISQGIGWRGVTQARLDITHRVVTEVTHQAAREDRQARNLGDTKPGLEALDILQRILLMAGMADYAVDLNGDIISRHLQYRSTRQANDGVSPPFLATLYRFEQVGIRAIGQLEVGTQGRVQVGQHGGRDRYTVVTLGRERLEPGGAEWCHACCNSDRIAAMVAV